MKRSIFVNGICEEGMNFKENSIKCDELKNSIAAKLEEILSRGEEIRFVTVMRQGADIYTALEILNLKSYYKGTELHCLLPFEEQANEINETARDRYFDIIERCDRQTFYQKGYTDGCVEECIEAAKKSCDAELNINITENGNFNIELCQ